MWVFIGLLSFAAFCIFVVLAIISVIKKNGLAKKRFTIAAATFVLLIIAVVADPNTGDAKGDKKNGELAKVSTAEVKEVNKQSEKKEVMEVNKKVEEVVKEKEESVPREHKAALEKAKLYAETMHMSKAGVYDQLTSEYGENFPKEAAQYAIDNIDFNWKESALKKAQTYAETMNMSNSAIYDQLISEYGEKFTKEEAQYAIDNLE